MIILLDELVSFGRWISCPFTGFGQQIRDQTRKKE